MSFSIGAQDWWKDLDSSGLDDFSVFQNEDTGKILFDLDGSGEIGNTGDYEIFSELSKFADNEFLAILDVVLRGESSTELSIGGQLASSCFSRVSDGQDDNIQFDKSVIAGFNQEQKNILALWVQDQMVDYYQLIEIMKKMDVDKLIDANNGKFAGYAAAMIRAVNPILDILSPSANSFLSKDSGIYDLVTNQQEKELLTNFASDALNAVNNYTGDKLLTIGEITDSGLITGDTGIDWAQSADELLDLVAAFETNGQKVDITDGLTKEEIETIISDSRFATLHANDQDAFNQLQQLILAEPEGTVLTKTDIDNAGVITVVKAAASNASELIANIKKLGIAGLSINNSLDITQLNTIVNSSAFSTLNTKDQDVVRSLLANFDNYDSDILPNKDQAIVLLRDVLPDAINEANVDAVNPENNAKTTDVIEKLILLCTNNTANGLVLNELGAIILGNGAKVEDKATDLFEYWKEDIATAIDMNLLFVEALGQHNSVFTESLLTKVTLLPLKAAVFGIIGAVVTKQEEEEKQNKQTAKDDDIRYNNKMLSNFERKGRDIRKNVNKKK